MGYGTFLRKQLTCIFHTTQEKKVGSRPLSDVRDLWSGSPKLMKKNSFLVVQGQSVVNLLVEGDIDLEGKAAVGRYSMSFGALAYKRKVTGIKKKRWGTLPILL